MQARAKCLQEPFLKKLENGIRCVQRPIHRCAQACFVVAAGCASGRLRVISFVCLYDLVREVDYFHVICVVLDFCLQKGPDTLHECGQGIR